MRFAPRTVLIFLSVACTVLLGLALSWASWSLDGSIFGELYLLPLVLAAVAFGVKGGVVASLCVAGLLASATAVSGSRMAAADATGLLLRSCMMVLTGVAVGGLVTEVRRSRAKVHLAHREFEAKICDAKTHSEMLLSSLSTMRQCRNEDLTRYTAIIDQISTGAERLASTFTLGDLYAAVLDLTKDVVGANKCSLLMLEDSGRHLAPASTLGWTEEESKGLQVDRRRGLIGWVMAHGEEITKLSAKRDSKLWEIVREGSLPSVLCAPIVHNGKPIGVINVESAEAVWPQQGSLLRIIARLTAMAIENARFVEQMQRMASTDPLTGLSGRTVFEASLAEEMGRTDDLHRPVSVIMSDIDNFKLTNDTYGHQAGDHVLSETARLFREAFREDDVTARYGGEEFVALLPGIPSHEAAEVAERVRRKVGEHEYRVGDSTIRVTISLGVASYPEHSLAGPHMVARADEALYRAKATGRDRVVVAGLERARPGKTASAEAATPAPAAAEPATEG